MARSCTVDFIAGFLTIYVYYAQKKRANGKIPFARFIAAVVSKKDWSSTAFSA